MEAKRLREARATAWRAFVELLGGLGTACLALAVLAWLVLVALTSVIGIGLLLAPSALRLLHAVADVERRRLSRRGAEVLAPGPLPTALREAAADPATRREVLWVAAHATGGLLLGVIGIQLPAWALRDFTFPLWWRMVPEGDATPGIGLWTVHDWPGVATVTLLGVVWAVMTVGLAPGMARLQSSWGRRLLAPGPETDLSLRIAELTSTRAAALDAHAVELRRIERSLHDGTQNRLVATTVLLGAARRMLTRDPAEAEVLLERAQGAAEQALAELRAVARGILPPVLADRGLAGALSGLASGSPVPCQVEVDVPARLAASVESTAYFVVAEALTNVAKHSGATHVEVDVRSRGPRLHVRITDDGRGGADEDGGSGLVGIRRRVQALDGTLTLTSPPGGPTTLEVELPCGS
ncbi:sensor histidine kinase [Actinoplanes friuliensis]|uniref:histidine kinase n=1 Tax=Actinoplanes friuliensis DSM 7358 TaxID=1246995 RepID=U5W2W0_9ACTN|nr:sensor histidine kinase [Actinoplanes friuliensis]AGZ42256.1 integral membrane sensor signal transduction histidine kinase [Actinoplanes friuliensis DSM 7358]